MKTKTSYLLGVTLLLIALAPPASSQFIDTLVLDVDGISNEGCSDYIDDVLLRDLDGIEGVQADHDTDIVTVRFDPNETSADDIAAAINSCHYFDVTGSSSHALDPQRLEDSANHSGYKRNCC